MKGRWCPTSGNIAPRANISRKLPGSLEIVAENPQTCTRNGIPVARRLPACGFPPVGCGAEDVLEMVPNTRRRDVLRMAKDVNERVLTNQLHL